MNLIVITAQKPTIYSVKIKSIKLRQISKENHLTTKEDSKKGKRGVLKKKEKGLGAVAHAYNPSTLGGRGRWITKSRDRDHPGQHGETPSLLKIQKISWAWWHMPVIPASQEAEAGESLEPGRRSLP